MIFLTVYYKKSSLLLNNSFDNALMGVYLIKIPRVEICFEFEKKVCQEKNIKLNMMLVKIIKNKAIMGFYLNLVY